MLQNIAMRVPRAKPSARMTTFDKPTAEQRGAWYVIDAKGLVLGRLATKIADLLRGKDQANFHNGADYGAHVVVINADEVVVTGAKETDKIYYRHTGYPGGIRSRTYAEMRDIGSGEPLYIAVKRMLPRTKLRNDFMKKLRLFSGATHTHEAQQPIEIKVL